MVRHKTFGSAHNIFGMCRRTRQSIEIIGSFKLGHYVISLLFCKIQQNRKKNEMKMKMKMKKNHSTNWMGTHPNKLGIFVLVVDFNLDKLWQSLFPNCLQLNWRGQSELLASSQIHSKWFLALLWFEQGCYSQIWVTLFFKSFRKIES